MHQAVRLGLPNQACLVIEDSIVGLRAAKSADMRCVITYTEQTADEDFYGFGADAKMLDFSSGVDVRYPCTSQLISNLLGATVFSQEARAFAFCLLSCRHEEDGASLF